MPCLALVQNLKFKSLENGAPLVEAFENQSWGKCGQWKTKSCDGGTFVAFVTRDRRYELGNNLARSIVVLWYVKHGEVYGCNGHAITLTSGLKGAVAGGVVGYSQIPEAIDAFMK
ncbi:hypothetical protein KsCSTR_00350 [Candidatus Kuenenia stuttgartiensis]|uniref:Uncharacterized protein n=1 Tax=Kuenenia stuttgartiensis TaxID=174633 RepID=A0A6G7GJ93_KUEST|nr:hypothetical protein [Candidatus Kuenenia stuttgartiensis]QII09414.1 hypothetical protein KsCSTR_00350 [Candidatus Kuenenia stuttgartiensis]